MYRKQNGLLKPGEIAPVENIQAYINGSIHLGGL